MKLNEIKSFCPVCGSIFDNTRLRVCTSCKCNLTKVIECNQQFSELNGTYTLKLNGNVIGE